MDDTFLHRPQPLPVLLFPSLFRVSSATSACPAGCTAGCWLVICRSRMLDCLQWLLDPEFGSGF
eukprot:2184137-Alexandrium_andersonii.AAC.1